MIKYILVTKIHKHCTMYIISSSSCKFCVLICNKLALFYIIYPIFIFIHTYYYFCYDRSLLAQSKIMPLGKTCSGRGLRNKMILHINFCLFLLFHLLFQLPSILLHYTTLVQMSFFLKIIETTFIIPIYNYNWHG